MARKSALRGNLGESSPLPTLWANCFSADLNITWGHQDAMLHTAEPKTFALLIAGNLSRREEIVWQCLARDHKMGDRG